ncbi:metallophosphoesterase [Anopheles sinensis]|uniref:Metallophosphoesterase n=1 Tax=Anopheles sinensis TaxID=74873 RepID=A0A084WUA2_ANOSI|nr:metallophosphoesterase [Anopheles sinensis]
MPLKAVACLPMPGRFFPYRGSGLQERMEKPHEMTLPSDLPPCQFQTRFPSSGTGPGSLNLFPSAPSKCFGPLRPPYSPSFAGHTSTTGGHHQLLSPSCGEDVLAPCKLEPKAMGCGCQRWLWGICEANTKGLATKRTGMDAAPLLASDNEEAIILLHQLRASSSISLEKRASTFRRVEVKLVHRIRFRKAGKALLPSIPVQFPGGLIVHGREASLEAPVTEAGKTVCEAPLDGADFWDERIPSLRTINGQCFGNVSVLSFVSNADVAPG